MWVIPGCLRRVLPHFYRRADDVGVRALLEGQEDQSILISGVSGAGKTETAKLLLGHLASVAGSEEGGVGSERIQHMVECTVVLESFGNAVMVREGPTLFFGCYSFRDPPRSRNHRSRAVAFNDILGVTMISYLITIALLLSYPARGHEKAHGRLQLV